MTFRLKLLISCVSVLAGVGAQACKILPATAPSPDSGAPPSVKAATAPAPALQVSPPRDEREIDARTPKPRPETPNPVPSPARAESRPAPAEVPVEPVGRSLDAVKTRDRLINVTAECDAAEQVYTQVKSDSAQLGQAPHPSITQSRSRMQLALDSARKELDRGEIAEARSSLDLAEAAAIKVLKFGGGN